MYRFIIDPAGFQEGVASLQGQELRHLTKVLRLGPGDCVTVFDGQGQEGQGTVLSLDKQEARIRIEACSLLQRESPLEVWLAQGIGKGEKMDFIIQKATELGVKGLIPLETRRTVVKLNDAKKEEKTARWQRIAAEAAKQCRRSYIPQVACSQSLRQFLQHLPENKVLLAPWEEGGEGLKKALLESPKDRSVPVYLLIGPEGGLEKEEVAQIKEKGGIIVSLGPRILRTETAGLAALSAIMYQWGDLG